jgi:sec-independent protein translocase protein TatC
MSDTPPDPSEGKILTFTDHLQELRVRIIICLSWFIVAFLISFAAAPQTISFLMQPLISLPRNQEHSILTLYLGPAGEVHGWAVADPSNEAPGAIRQKTLPTSTTLALLARDSFRIQIEGQPNPILIGPKTQAHLTFLTPLEPFFLWIQGALLLSSVLTIPMLVWQFWLFISPGLLRSERGIVGPLLSASILLFPMGAGFAYAISQIVLKALLGFGDSIPFLEPNLVASRYISFILIMMFMFGLVFEFPLVLLLLSRLGIVDSGKLTRQRRLAIVVMAVIAAVATPSPDPFSMMIMLAPLLVLYEGSIWTIRLMERRDAARQAAEAT